ncbi:hypothetical protein HJC23_013404 [Cyclotella cryptica]|uniref:Uncharacterized protein n=1 Tax=Cyclotella cryptica TaxID=29204 RepID=A0ABD3PVM4_9STRA|eukprot:CCRYP_010974-RA/>CCRYP_010974-RA protein AED:0.10 eAED:0.10 QI:0/0.5/0.66/1/0.5/0.33/3/560/408
MGRILDALRRKRSGPSTPTSLSCDSPCTSPLNTNSCDDIDKENNGTVGNKLERKEALRLGKREVLVDERDVEACIEVTLSDSTSVDDNDATNDNDNRKKPGSVERNDSNDSDIVAVASSSESTIVSNEHTAVSVSELTEVSDDGILRDDEGNPIDLLDAEENMLRDDEGNIIDPKTLVVRDFLLDLSCESDEYYDDSGEHIDPKELISCIGVGQAHLPIVTDSSTHSEGEADCESAIPVQPLHEINEGVQPPTAESINREYKREQSSTFSNRDAENYENLESKGQKSSSSSRRRRRKNRTSTTANMSEYIHIMFNNRLTTLEEESLSSHHHIDDSGDEADDESPAPSPRSRQRSPTVNGIGSFDEKFIKARWEYSLQMMSCGTHTSGAVLDDVMVAADTIGLDDEGEI